MQSCTVSINSTKCSCPLRTILFSHSIFLLIKSPTIFTLLLAYHSPLGESDHVYLTFKLHQQDQHNVLRTNRIPIEHNLNALLLDNDWKRMLNGMFQCDYTKFTNILMQGIDHLSCTKAEPPGDKANALNESSNSIFTVENMDIPLPMEEFKGEILSNITITPDLVWEKLKTLNPNKSTSS